MNRRGFLNRLGMGGVASTTGWASLKGVVLPAISAPAAGGRGKGGRGLPEVGPMPNVRWQKSASSAFYTQVLCEATPLVYRGQYGVLTASWTVEGASGTPPLLGLEKDAAQFGGCTGTLRHKLLRAGQGSGEDVLEAELTLRNENGKAIEVAPQFTSSARPFAFDDQVLAHFPLSATGLEAMGKADAPDAWAANAVGPNQFRDCEQPSMNNEESGGSLVAHYLEPYESDPPTLISQAPLLIPLVDLGSAKVDWRVALFCSPLRAWRIGDDAGWSCKTRTRIEAGAERAEKCYFFIHRGGPEVAWRAFHMLAHPEETPRAAWLDEAIVHYYDFLSPGAAGGKRGPGYDEDVHEFRTFSVGLATQHGYYPY